MMKTLVRFFSIVFITSAFFSCTENYKEIDPSSFNKKISARNDIKTPDELITLYYNYPSNEGNPKFRIQSQEISKNTFLTTLIREVIDDDSVWGEKVIMKAVLENDKWLVLEIRKNWKCQYGRNYGSPKWGIEGCS